MPEFCNATAVTAPTHGSVHFIKDYPSTAVQVFLGVVMFLVFIVSVSGNSLVCFIVFRRPSMRSAINLLLANLALGDCLLSALNMPIAITVLYLQKWPFSKSLCEFNALIFLLFNTEKAFILVVIALDRYFIIVKRRNSLNPFKAKWICASTWLLAFCVSAPPLFGWGRLFFPRGCVQCRLDVSSPVREDRIYLYFSLSVMLFLPCSVVLVVFYHIARTVHRARYRIQNHPPVHPTAMHRKGKMYIDYSYKTRTFYSVFLLSVTYTLCMFPLAVTDMWRSTYPSAVVSAGPNVILISVSYLHCALNSIIFYLRISRFREACFELPKLPLSFSYWKVSRARRRVQPHIMYRADKGMHKSDLFIV